MMGKEIDFFKMGLEVELTWNEEEPNLPREESLNVVFGVEAV